MRSSSEGDWFGEWAGKPYYCEEFSSIDHLLSYLNNGDPTFESL